MTTSPLNVRLEQPGSAPAWASATAQITDPALLAAMASGVPRKAVRDSMTAAELYALASELWDRAQREQWLRARLLRDADRVRAFAREARAREAAAGGA